MKIPHFDIIIVGAGPAGATFVKAMQYLPYSLAVIDKAIFPRDKACGDAIPGRAVKVWESITKTDNKSLHQLADKHLIKGSTVFAPNGQSLTIHYKGIGYTSPRKTFDHFLYQTAYQNTKATFLEGETIKSCSIKEDKATVTLDNSKQLTSKLIIGCDGSHSIVAKQLTSRKVDRAHHCGAVRAYFKNLRGIEDHIMTVFLLKDFLPGYFWIFPLGNNLYNVGFGMLSKDISQKKINLRQALKEIIQATPQLKSIFINSQQIGEVLGFSLPLGSRRLAISGNRFMLTGDAASLIDPATGEGIGNAMLSAQLAAEQAKKCFIQNNFSANFLKEYDQKVYAKLGRELRQKYWIQKLLKDRTWLINLTIGQAANNPLFKRFVQKLI